MSNRELKEGQKQTSTLESESPVDLYWLHREPTGLPAVKEKPVDDDKTIICDEFWDEFKIVCGAVLIRDRDATLYDAFNFVREHMLGGWTYLEDSAFIKDADEKVERDYKEEVRQGKWTNSTN